MPSCFPEVRTRYYQVTFAAPQSMAGMIALSDFDLSSIRDISSNSNLARQSHQMLG
jgi:hypothetical protein